MSPIIGSFASGGSFGGKGGLAPNPFLYDFTSATFTPGGSAGRDGPSLSQARSGLSGTGVDSWKNNTEYFNTSSGIQLWTVPADGIYEFTVTGAQGGNSNSATGGGGNPARIVGRVSLTVGQVMRIVCGQAGKQGSGGTKQNSSGGGGSFVYDSGNTLYFAAGGGGGGSSGSAPSSCNANTGNNGRAGSNSSGDGNGNAGGTNGGRGQHGYTYGAGGGGGWNTASHDNGQSTLCTYPSPVTNGVGRPGGFRGGYGYSSCQESMDGGFGGGGGGAGACCTSGAGGGGGYSGGGVGNDCCSSKGGGGGSYIISTATNTSTSNVSQLNGSVVVSFIG